MQSSPQSAEKEQCPVCRAEIKSTSGTCGQCGLHPSAAAAAQEIRSVHYLLSELARWEERGLINSEQASALRTSYELRREALRAELAANGRAARSAATHQEIQNEGQKNEPGARVIKRRAWLEKLTEPHTIRILLYAGAAMLVVGIIIWLRDVLYMKLQEPAVQAALLAIITIGATLMGWLTILRTRLLLTGKALTLVGSLLVPVNFWFLERSGLLESGRRAWIVCAICALLYALTAAFLREKFYVYLASAATIATLWALIYRYDPEAYGLYALSLTGTSILLLHLSRQLPSTEEGERNAKDNPPSFTHTTQSRLPARRSYELWGAPLMHVALFGAGVSALLYMLLRLGVQASVESFRFSLNDYDPTIAIVLFAAAAYITWFAGWRVYTDRRTVFYATSALSLIWIEFLALDALRARGANRLVILAATMLVVAFATIFIREQALASALRYACFLTSIALSLASYAFTDIEIYTSLIALALLIVADLSARQKEAMALDDGLLFWAGSILLGAPLLIRALEFRLLMDVAAPMRDLATLSASLALILFGVVRRLRAPLLVGLLSLALELTALALKSINWLQVPLKIYLISTGALILVVWGLLEFRREQILSMRKHIQERRDYARERFGEWR